jgi:hypothetical protein
MRRTRVESITPSMQDLEYLSNGVTRRMAAVLCRGFYRGKTGPFGPRLCRILDANF